MDGDSTTGTILSAIALLVLILLSSFFSAAETAFSSLNEIRLKAKAEAGDKKAQNLLKMVEKFDPLLSTVLIGNNIVNIAMSSIGTVMFSAFLGKATGATVSTIVITLLVLIFGEITPKSLAKERPEGFATFAAPILGFLMLIFTPLTFIFGVWKKFIAKRFHVTDEDDAITDEELVTMVNVAEEDGELTAHESELIKSAIEFDDVDVQEILTPRVDVIAARDDITPEALQKLFLETEYSRIPVYHDTIDNIIGVIHEKDYYAALETDRVDIEELIKPTIYTTTTTKISEVLRTLREKRHHLAVVVDEYGGTEGIVTMEDVLEELVGEIWDEHDVVTTDFREQQGGGYLVSGAASVTDLFELLDIDEEEEDIESQTVSGLVQEKLSHLPKVGDKFEFDDYDGVVTRTSKRRVTEVRIKRKEDKEISKHEVTTGN